MICAPSDITRLVPLDLLGYREAVRLAFDKVEQEQVLASWADVRRDEALADEIAAHLTVPKQGCFVDVQKVAVRDRQCALENIFAVGGKRGWYYANFLWNLRGWIDKVLGGTGMSRRLKMDEDLQPGQRVGLWRVLIADRAEQRLLLYAGMKLRAKPGWNSGWTGIRWCRPPPIALWASGAVLTGI